MSLKIDILTIFPDMFAGPFSESMLKRAQEDGLVEINVHNLRDWTEDRHQQVDDNPFGGGPGMVMMLEPIYKALKDIKNDELGDKSQVVLTSAKGKTFNQKQAQEFASELEQLIIVCGHYEGVDERVAKHLVNFEVSIGNYILTGGELPAMIISDAVIRLIPGVLGNEDSLATESFTKDNELEHPHYTRPAQFETDDGQVWGVPDVLLSGDHGKIAQWRKQQMSQQK